MRERLSIAHVIGIFSPEHGGPVVSCRNYVTGQAERGHTLSLFTLEGYSNASRAIRLGAPVKQFVGRVDWPEKLGRSNDLRNGLRLSATADIYHLHGIWLRGLFYGYEKARRERRPFVIEINGALDPLELCTKPWRKRFVRWWYQDRMLRAAPCIHVNSEREAVHVRALGFGAPIVIIPAGFNFCEFDMLAEQAKSMTPAWSEKLGDRRTLLYLSRIHPAKGIDDLILAWSRLAGSFPDWDLLIVGPGEQQEVDAWRDRTRAAGIEARCHWVGMVPDIERAWAYRRADVYVLPSHKENFGNTVQEALGYGTPALTTRKTPWTDLGRWDAGWVCDDNAQSLEEALGAALATPVNRLHAMGANGRQIIQQKFSLTSVINDQVAVYSWLLGGAEPTCLWSG